MLVIIVAAQQHVAWAITGLHTTDAQAYSKPSSVSYSNVYAHCVVVIITRASVLECSWNIFTWPTTCNVNVQAFCWLDLVWMVLWNSCKQWCVFFTYDYIMNQYTVIKAGIYLHTYIQQVYTYTSVRTLASGHQFTLSHYLFTQSLNNALNNISMFKLIIYYMN